jgi:hypothetical protein
MTVASFRCGCCGERFSIANPPSDKRDWVCPWCGRLVVVVGPEEAPATAISPAPS